MNFLRKFAYKDTTVVNLIDTPHSVITFAQRKWEAAFRLYDATHVTHQSGSEWKCT